MLYWPHGATKIKLYFAFKETFQAQFMERCRLVLPFWCPLGTPIKTLVHRFSPELLNIPALCLSLLPVTAAWRERGTIHRHAAEGLILLLTSVQTMTHSTNQLKNIASVAQMVFSLNF